jgi:stearoyl-CoA desaturase (delta-9 desaturase)
MALEFVAGDAAGKQRSLARLPYPAGLKGGGIYWRYAIAVGGYHVLGLLVFVPWFFSWQGVTLAVVGVYVFGGLGINLCYHRLLSHRSFSTPLWLEHVFAILAVCCLEDTPARWVAVHRKHHHLADEEPDPHSPLAGLFWSYVGWLFVENTENTRINIYNRYARDIMRDRFYVQVERLYVWIILASWIMFFLAGFAAALIAGDSMAEAAKFGASIWLWGVVVRTIAVWHVTWSGNSFPHLWGYRNYETNDNSRNNFLVAMITSGEGWHNNHHADPNSASNSHRWWELDLTYLFLRLLVFFRLAWNVKLPSRP